MAATIGGGGGGWMMVPVQTCPLSFLYRLSVIFIVLHFHSLTLFILFVNFPNNIIINLSVGFATTCCYLLLFRQKKNVLWQD